MVLDQGVLTPEVINHAYDGAGSDEDPYVVVWLEKDTRNPYQWRTLKKWSFAMCMAVATLSVSFCSSAFAGGLKEIIDEFHASQELATLGLSFFVLGFALGPLVFAPMSELYGRQLLYIVTFGCFACFNAGCAGSQNIWSLLILRFFAGSFGSSPLTNAGGVIADMFGAKERGRAMTIFATAPFMGPVLGPIIGGFLGQYVGWRWLEGFMAIFTGVVWIVASLIVPETYAPVLLRQRARNLSKVTGKVYRSRIDVDQGKVTAGEAFKTGLARPWLLLFREPIVFVLSIYMAIIYGTLYMLFGAYPIVYQQQRGWSEGIGGLSFIGVAIGMLFAIVYSIFYDDKRYQKVVAQCGGFAPPETRLHGVIVGGCVLPVGLFWFAWTNSPSLPWAASMAAGIPFGFGMVMVFLGLMNYLIDSYTIFAASVLAANSVLRSCFGAAFPLFTTQMYARLGIHWASSIPGFLAVACIPFPFLFYKYGGAIRARCKYAAEADAFMKKLRNQAAEDGDSPEMEEQKEEEALQERYTEDGELVTAKFERIKTGRTVASQGRYEEAAGPFDIDRVNTRESFKRVSSRNK
ncbi:hypothetical protein BP5796_07686 [Coleophoma crateriformis]|uniref:Major facilitator superfamily (MFS) profile domain-containing protein n=1 Tax=Coleophoma crateriformis TaxID=565419 RepID=A0A3D8RC78_9HELO|nr:hypothetical protein BP5796_07686 [Coleophoma crateriformis]